MLMMIRIVLDLNFYGLDRRPKNISNWIYDGGKHELAKEHESTNLFLMMSLFMSISSKFVDASSVGRSVCLSEVWLVCPLDGRLVRVP